MAQQGKKSTPAKKAPAAKRSRGPAATARAGGRKAARKVGSLMAKPVKALEHEHPQTIAKMAVAALTPVMTKAALKFLARNPIIAIGGAALVVGAVLVLNEPDETA